MVKQELIQGTDVTGVKRWVMIKMSSYLPAGITQAMCDVGVWEHEFAINNVGEKCERCRLCGTLVSEVDTELPLEEGVCYTCMWGDE